MTTVIAIVAGIATFLLTQAIAAFALGYASGSSQLFTMLMRVQPWATVTRLAVWAACGWLGVMAYAAVA
jgi:hypothetical protein